MCITCNMLISSCLDKFILVLITHSWRDVNNFGAIVYTPPWNIKHKTYIYNMICHVMSWNIKSEIRIGWRSVKMIFNIYIYIYIYNLDVCEETVTLKHKNTKSDLHKTFKGNTICGSKVWLKVTHWATFSNSPEFYIIMWLIFSIFWATFKPFLKHIKT